MNGNDLQDRIKIHNDKLLEQKHNDFPLIVAPATWSKNIKTPEPFVRVLSKELRQPRRNPVPIPGIETSDLVTPTYITGAGLQNKYIKCGCLMVCILLILYIIYIIYIHTQYMQPNIQYAQYPQYTHQPNMTYQLY